jgi:hypothetical protein
MDVLMLDNWDLVKIFIWHVRQSWFLNLLGRLSKDGSRARRLCFSQRGKRRHCRWTTEYSTPIDQQANNVKRLLTYFTLFLVLD